MSLPININDVLHARTVEWERLEFKEGWNPEAILHTICAFANDFHNLGGGYIFVGIREESGRPILPPAGLDPTQIDNLQKEILNLGYQIQPAYHPIIAPYEIDRRVILALWAPGGQNRPYRAPESLGKGNRTYHYYIRKGSSTVRARSEDIAELMSLANRVPFDDAINQRATIDDLKASLIQIHLRDIGSSLVDEAVDISFEQLCRRMNIVEGAQEYLFPRNVGLMFFNDNPNQFFPYTQIDVVQFPDGLGGDTIIENTFRGPLGQMLQDALRYIRSTVIKEVVVKHSDRAEAERYFNYPFPAIEESLVNAVYHRSYELREPIEVRILPDRITITSYPGADRSISLNELASGAFHARRYRNRRIGEFLKELRLAEGRGTGIPKIRRAMNDNGSPPPQFITDDDRTHFTVILLAHPPAIEELGAANKTSGQVQGDMSVRDGRSFIPRPPAVGFIPRKDRSGRDLVEKLKEELDAHKSQVLALWGPGGAGKTTLAVETARSMSETFGRRIIWISSEARPEFTFTSMLDEIVTQLGHADLRTLATEQKCAAASALTSETPSLIILDNFETIAHREQKLCVDFLKNRARSSAIITTREWIEDVISIPISSMSPSEAEEFLGRLISRVHDPSVFASLDRKQIIQLSEANPLIIQWIIAQIDLAQDTNEVLNDLLHGEGGAAQRVFDRSFNLPQMAEGGRAVLLALSLFMPSATRPALAEVAGMSRDKDKKRFKKAQQTLASLWLIKQTAGGQRLAVQGLTRELTKVRLARDPRAKSFRQRFVVRFLRYVEANSMAVAQQLNSIDEEKDNILSAIDVAYEMKDWPSVLKISTAISNYLALRGYWDEAIGRAEQAVAAARAASNELAAATFAETAAVIRMYRGEYDKARTIYREVLDVYKKVGDRTGVASILYNLARVAQEVEDLEEARRLYSESIEESKRLNNVSGVASSLQRLGIVAQHQGDLSEARRLFEESLGIERSLGGQSGIAENLHNLGVLSQAQDDPAAAKELYESSLSIAKELGNQQLIALNLHRLGLIIREGGDLEAASRMLRDALSILEKLGSPRAAAVRRDLANMEETAIFQ